MSEQEKIIAFPDLRDIELQAAEWIMRLEDDELSAADRAAFHKWRSTSEQHREALARLTCLWGDLNVAEELNDYAAADSNALVLKSRAWPRWRKFLTAAAASLAVVVFSGLTYRAVNDLRNLQSGAYQTAIGEQKTVKLPDGSSILLNTDSQVEIDFTKTARNIRLLRGEAFFTVAHNKQKPFSVYAGNGVVTAVGTAFTVRLRNNEKVDVLVAEGRVALSSRSFESGRLMTVDSVEPPAAKLLEVTAGQNAVFDQKVEQLDHVEPAALNRKLSWRDGMLSFSGDALSDVVADVSRYTDISIEIEDESLGQLPIAGYFKVGEVDAMFEALEVMADVRVERVGPKLVRLSKEHQG